jgi:hypothetical protein
MTKKRVQAVKGPVVEASGFNEVFEVDDVLSEARHSVLVGHGEDAISLSIPGFGPPGGQPVVTLEFHDGVPRLHVRGPGGEYALVASLAFAKTPMKAQRVVGGRRKK